MNEVIIENKKTSIILTILVALLLLFITVIPLVFHFFFYYSPINKFIISNFYFIYVLFLLFFSIVYSGVFEYEIKFSYSSFIIHSRRTVSSWFGSRVYSLELSNDMLIGFRFIESFLSINDKLLIQIKSSSGRKSAVRIPLTLIRKRRKKKLLNIFNQIMEKNGCQTK
mgnify:CR=1 FL=1|tara:strand:+ start:261 stop:764 length:504 start_codon:yes stop_codon:yes gene_type:complete